MTLLLTFIQKAIGQGVAILFGASGEIVTEKSGNLNLGIPGIMYMGGIAGLMGAFFYEKSTETPNGAIGVLVSLLCSLIASALGGLIYSFLTITLRANQNVVGLALTTFGRSAAPERGAGGLKRNNCQTLVGLPFSPGCGSRGPSIRCARPAESRGFTSCPSFPGRRAYLPARPPRRACRSRLHGCAPSRPRQGRRPRPCRLGGTIACSAA